MSTVIIIILTTIGTLFILIAAIGLLRMPDFFLRLSVTVKAATLGVGFIMGGTALYFLDFSVTAKVSAIVFFLLLTAPVSGHMIARTAYFTGMSLWKNTILDELKGKYDRKTHILSGDPDDLEDPDTNDEMTVDER